jgi:hypothetical protein
MSKSSANTIRLHGELYHTFNHALAGRGLLRLAFRPLRKLAITYWLWGLTCLMAGSLVLSYKLEREPFFLATIGFMFFFFVVAELALQHGVRQAFPSDSLVSNLNQQPWKLRRAIIRYAYFCESLCEQRNLPSVDELDDCLGFIEINRNGRPPSWTSFLRHPLVVTTYGILIYTFNIYIVGIPKAGGNWTYFANVGLLVFFVLFIGGLIYTFRYMDPNAHWEFECCVRWYRIQRGETLADVKRLKPNGSKVEIR